MRWAISSGIIAAGERSARLAGVRFRIGKGVSAVAGGQRAGNLEINQDLRFQRRMWAVQRIGWAVMALIVLVGLVGVVRDGTAQ
jgi:hypothetical protein